MYQDIHVMMFIGFGFLMTFLEKYGLSASGFNFLVTAVAILWNTLLSAEDGLFFMVYNGKWGTIPLSLMGLVQSDFGAATCLISMVCAHLCMHFMRVCREPVLTRVLLPLLLGGSVGQDKPHPAGRAGVLRADIL
jgi:hypothetical protein